MTDKEEHSKTISEAIAKKIDTLDGWDLFMMFAVIFLGISLVVGAITGNGV